MIKEKFRKKMLLVSLNIWRWLHTYSMKKAAQCMEDADWFMRNADEALENQLITIAELKDMEK